MNTDTTTEEMGDHEHRQAIQNADLDRDGDSSRSGRLGVED